MPETELKNLEKIKAQCEQWTKELEVELEPYKKDHVRLGLRVEPIPELDDEDDPGYYWQILYKVNKSSRTIFLRYNVNNSSFTLTKIGADETFDDFTAAKKACLQLLIERLSQDSEDF